MKKITFLILLVSSVAFAQPKLSVRGGFALGTMQEQMATEMNVAGSYKSAEISGGIIYNKYQYGFYASTGARVQLKESGWYVLANGSMMWLQTAEGSQSRNFVLGGGIEKHIHQGIVYISVRGNSYMLGVKVTWYRE